MDSARVPLFVPILLWLSVVAFHLKADFGIWPVDGEDESFSFDCRVDSFAISQCWDCVTFCDRVHHWRLLWLALSARRSPGASHLLVKDARIDTAKPNALLSQTRNFVATGNKRAHNRSH